MTLFGIVVRNLRYYWRQHLGVIAGAALCSMVLVGALMVGDSVKTTLRRIADERIGKADMALLSTDGFFREELALEVSERLGGEIVVAPVVLTRGNLSLPDGSIVVRNVQVLGVDELFWKLAPVPDAKPPFESGAFFANERLYWRFKNRPHDRIILRVEEPGLFSRDAPLSGERDNKFVALSNKLGGSVSSEGFGRFGLQGNQREPLTLFVPLKLLQKRMFRNFDEVAGKSTFANFLLLGNPGGEIVSAEKAEIALNDAWSLIDAGVSVKELRDEPAWSVRSRQVFLSDSLRRAGESASPETTGALTYLVNAIAKGGGDDNASALMPYSMVTAVAPAKTAFLPDDLGDDEIALVAAIFLHQHRIRPIRHRRAGEDADRFARPCVAAQRMAGRHPSGHGQRGLLVRVQIVGDVRRRLGPRLELHDAPVHLGDRLVVGRTVGHCPGDELVDEEALAQRGLLGSHHIGDLGVDGELLTRGQVPVVGLLTVGRHHSDIAGVVEQVHHLRQRIVVRAALSEAAHRPHLDHRRWRHDPGVPGGLGGLLVDVDRILVADGVHPVMNHRLVHWIPAGSRLALTVRLDRVDALLEIGAHRITLGTFRPEAEIISRITSLTPPPNVMTRLRLVILSSQSSSSAVSVSAGFP